VLPTILGISDGILNALILAAGAILRDSGRGLGAVLALKVGAAAFVTAGFTMFVAYYSERRSHLIRSAKQLNMTEPGRLATTNLGRAIALESAGATAVAATASLLGACLPLLLGTLLPLPTWVTLAITVALLGLLGWTIGAMLSARATVWCLAMIAGGVVVTAVGAVLDIA